MCKHDGGFDIVKTKNGVIKDVVCSDCGNPLMMIIAEQQDRIDNFEKASRNLTKAMLNTDPLTVPIKISSAIITLADVIDGNPYESEVKAE